MAHEASKDTSHARRAGVTPPRQQAAQRARPMGPGRTPPAPAGRPADDPFKDLPAPKPKPLMAQFYDALTGNK